MNQTVTRGIVLGRTDFQEADRILTILTPDQGKLRVMAKGVRKIKSKLAGGIELFGINQLTFIAGRGEIATLISSRLEKHFNNISKDIDRTMLGYELLKRINRATEDNVGAEYFELLQEALRALDDEAIPLEIIELWFSMRLLAISGHVPNTKTDNSGEPLVADAAYEFDIDNMAFSTSQVGSYSSRHIKLLNLAARTQRPAILCQVKEINNVLEECLKLAKTILGRSVRI